MNSFETENKWELSNIQEDYSKWIQAREDKFLMPLLLRLSQLDF